ncbi:ABC transporter ATP-binding protein [Stenotrophomonas sp.]|uniref:ABC transporter ATP-binding protein n=1 Tax=Stenotrophomonas sp. TaxID=69392 RepID=UPI00374C8A1C
MNATYATPPLLKVTNLVKTFSPGGGLMAKGSGVRAVDGVSFSISPGETLGLVGETGSGKSTLGRLVLKLIEPTSGTIEFDGADVTALRGRQARALRGRMQMVFQDPYGSLNPRMTVNDLIREPMLVHGYGGDELKGRLESTMRQVGIDPRMGTRYPHEFSGGQRQRIGIARALVLDPKLLILDEPVSALDVSIQAQILNLLRDIQRRTGIAYLFIAHDLAVVRHISDRVAVMYLGRIVEMAPRHTVYEAPRHPYTKALLSAVPVPNPVTERGKKRIPLHGEIGSAASMPSGCSFHPRCFRARHAALQPGVEAEPWGKEMLPIACIHKLPGFATPHNDQVVACHFALLPDSFDAAAAHLPQENVAA